jgi:LysM repeat protein
MTPKYITIHSTANPKSLATGERGWLTNPSNTRTASWHYCVDSNGTVVEAIPPNEVAWHAGDGNGQGNRASIGVEICESGNREQAYAHAIKLVAYLMKKHNITELRRHYDWSRKNCPRIMNKNGNWAKWYWFEGECQKAYKALTSVSKPSPSSNPNYHVIQAGDTLCELSRHYNVSVNELRRLNPAINPTALRIGDKIKVKDDPKPTKLGTVKVLATKLWYYGSADWNDKIGQANKGEVFTVVQELTVDGYKMYKLISGTYITANPKYVQFNKN